MKNDVDPFSILTFSAETGLDTIKIQNLINKLNHRDESIKKNLCNVEETVEGALKESRVTFNRLE
jgi:hypothetical protein